MEKKYLAAVWDSTGDLRLEEKSLRPLNPGEVLLRVKAAGICGTDLHLINGEYPGCIPPIVPGHEFSGLIEASGDEGNAWLAGKRVGCDSYIGCGKCVYCLNGQRQICTHGTRELGIHVDGGWAEYVIVPAENVYLLPDNVSYIEAGAGCILNCPFAAIESVNPGMGDFMLIIGDGPSSLIMLQIARLKGADPIYIAGHRAKRLALAESLGADRAINTHEEDIVSIMHNLDKEPDIVIDAVGKAETFNWALNFAGTGARINFFGLPGKPLNGIEMEHFLFKELKLTGSTGNPAYWEPAIKLLSKGLLKVRPVIGHTFKLKEINEAISYIKENPEEVVKAMIAGE